MFVIILVNLIIGYLSTIDFKPSVMTKNKENKEEPREVESQENHPEEEKSEQVKKSPVRLITIIVLTCCVIFFLWLLAADRHTPYTSQARLNALVVPIVPKVSGYLKEANVRLHSLVKYHDTMFVIDKKLYKLAVQYAEANVDKATQKMGFQGAAVKSAAGRLGMANAQLDRAQRNYNRVMQVFDENPGALSLADRDAAETALASATEQVSSAEADLEKAKQNLGNYGPENADLREAISQLEKAHLNLSYTSVYAPSDGIVESFNLDVGHYCSAGSPLATFISLKDVWIQADFRENSLENIIVGEDVEFILDIAPGRKFKGTVRSIGYAVSSGQDVNRGGLPSVKGRSGWLRETQRFPVIISFNEESVMEYFKIGGQADVVVYSDKHEWLNRIARFRLWINGKLSYVR